MTPSAAVYACAAAIAAGFAFFLARIPVQVSDSVLNIATAFSSSWAGLFVNELDAGAFLRPLIHVQTKAVLDLAPGHEYQAFRTIQIAQVGVAFWLFARVLRVRAWADAAGALVALVVFAGSHTFATLVLEGYPINNYLTVALCTLVALNVVMQDESRRWTDALVAAAFVLAVGTIETGLLVWVIVTAGLIAGCRGVSRPAAATLTLMVVAYFAARFLVLDVGTPDLLERSSGFGLRRLEPAQLAERFGDNPLPFYAYNVASSLSTVLLSEPRNGIFTVARGYVDGDLRPWMVVNLLSGAAATALIVWSVFSAPWRRAPREWTRSQRLLFIAAGVVAANAAISYPYAKDQVMSAAGIFVAMAVAVPVAALAARAPRTAWTRAAAVALVAATAALWSLRVAGQQHLLVHTAFVTRNDWATVDARGAVARFGADPALVRLVDALRARALASPPAYPHVWSSRAVEEWLAH